ncbi:hypothetical protein RF11_08519 [Thelohanellus kitauei]|uniref:Uncharacterized protein n=1 Tax=Thelohanellus kitauei TaxID=669202 RepID=A0A0C2N111_THEKT|nr:hypothetical protein RF11_08519 [Thelohanellus kitauei]
MREKVKPSFLMILKKKYFTEIPESLDPALFFHDEDIKNAFNLIGKEIEDYPSSKVTKLTNEADSASLESFSSELRDTINTTFMAKHSIGSIGFIHRDNKEENGITIEDIKEKYGSKTPYQQNTFDSRFDDNSSDLEYYT